jgi:hypothetical protein
MARKIRYILLVLTLFLIAGIFFFACTPPAPLLGTWSGILQTSLTTIPMTTILNLHSDGTYTATAYSTTLYYFNYHGSIYWDTLAGSMNYTYMGMTESTPHSFYTTLLLGASSADHTRIAGTGYTSDLGNITLTANEN